jgi:hypothetical protein
LFSSGLAGGIALGVLLAGRAWTGTAQFYTELMQLLIRVLTVPAPALGALGLVAMSIDAALLFNRGQGAALALGLGAIALGVVALALTKFGHFPINDQVLGWNPASPPADWTRMQAKWSALHLGRTVAAVGGFGLLLLSNLLRS